MATGTQPATEPSLTSLVTGIGNDAQLLLKQQLELFKREVKDDARRMKEAALSLGSGSGIIALGIIFLCLGLVHLLHWAVPEVYLWAWYGIVGIVLVACGGTLLYMGRRKLASFNPLPDQSVAALRENIQWITSPRT